MPGQNGGKPKQRKSKRRHHNGDNPKWRQDEGNITKTATEKCGQNGDKEQRTAKCFKEWLQISCPQSTTALHLGRLLNRSKQTSKKLCEATTTPLHSIAV